ncbi:sister chromatid cohesion protein DCC1 isoform X2 [Lingula anatina]|uniref:Sister chromatid cohesion protein DCC1 n=1 Tax=Lingula anatina TaxID=7574 RepID=A0A1S3IFT1_LINAN|nr:sister chromatid cohesion protein DCC1 isoform X2 [Lingula anatina]|eukprot:XP_013396721.1 sister chromatid cohesion protein DCC1 isoform X2 [Lingula anatina]
MEVDAPADSTMDAYCTTRMLSNGDRLTIRGDKTDSAVVCTNRKTFEIKEAETSNSVLILPDLLLPEKLGEKEIIIEKEVSAILYNYFELRPIKPRLKKMKELLEENVYSGPECEEDENHHGRKYSYADLKELVQASEGEIQEGLKALQAVEIDGYIRMLDFDYLQKVLSSIAGLVEENDWTTDHLPLRTCLEELQDLYDRHIIIHVLDCYGTKSDPGGGKNMEADSADVEYALCESKICRFYAEILLRASEKFNLQEFLLTWQESVPVGMKTDSCQLEGLALIDKTSRPEVIIYFPVEELPEDIEARFNALFRVREKWTKEEITPYIKDVATEKMGTGALLMKYARASTSNGVKVYNSKKAVT